jgi:hypothetical protein
MSFWDELDVVHSAVIQDLAVFGTATKVDVGEFPLIKWFTSIGDNNIT